MMTSPSTIRSPTLARTVRQVVSQQPEQVNEVWCRRIFRNILQALERHHALRQPHAPISPDTIGFDAHGDPVLLPADGATAEPGEAADVQALGAVVHYAITWEPQPLTLLRTQALDGFSESLVGAVNKCIAPDPAERPQSIAELRNLLGIVALGAVLPHATPEPIFAPVETTRTASIFGPDKWQRWMLICLAAVVLLAAASALWMLLRDADGGDNVALTLPEAVPASHSASPNAAPAHVLPAPSAPVAPASPATTPAVPDHATTVLRPAPATRSTEPDPAASSPARSGAPSAAPARDAQQAPSVTYKLMVKPWGTVYVDGAERGISPPLKHLRLAPGQHTVRVVNPNYRDRVLRIDAQNSRNGRIDVDFGQRSR